MSRLNFFLIFLFALSKYAAAATIIKVSKTKSSMVIKLDPSEKETLLAGEKVSIQYMNKSSQGIIKKSKGQTALVQLDDGTKGFKKGMIVKTVAGSAKSSAEREIEDEAEKVASSETLFKGEDHSAFIDNASQLYRTQELNARLDLLMGATLTSYKSTEETSTNVDFLAAHPSATYHAPSGFAVQASYTTIRSEIDDDDYKLNRIDDETAVSAALTKFDHFSAGFSYLFKSAKNSVDFDGFETSGSLNYTEFRPSVAFYTNQLEISLLYKPSINLKEDFVNDQSAGEMVFIANYFLTNKLSLLGGLTHQRNSDVSDQEKDSINYVIGSEWRILSSTISAQLEYEPAYYKDDLDMDAGNIASTALQVGSTFDINRLYLGVFAYHARGSDSFTVLGQNYEVSSRTTLFFGSVGYHM